MRPAFSLIPQRRQYVVVLSAIFLLAVVFAAPATSPVQSKDEIWNDFSGDKALEHVRRLVDLGPRPAGSEAIEKTRTYIVDQLSHMGWDVTRQVFTDETPRGKVTFVNLVAQFRGAENKRSSTPSFLLCSHYDTKLFASFRFVGANDGGSSTGLLLELARVLAQNPSLAGKIEFVFFDGEEAYENFSASDGLYGSRHFAKQLAETKAAKQFRGGVLFDMVGDSFLNVTLPPNSPSQMARDIFAAADVLKLRNYFTYFDRDVTDDHTPLNAIGIPTIDLIDFDFVAWHTAQDTIDKVSAQSLQTVGSVAVYYLSQFALK